ncbi:hypothetical protein RI543_001792 [Arxiozyma heterogenica]|uniref:PH domain-containing protein n=1 Tax=Arxiozyma heterogenica TaxID=278026 RepID=A0AAN7WMQ0_9SACH|nr:hypothetical protein RI543_001792 [Kazachstania heterogenica]
MLDNANNTIDDELYNRFITEVRRNIESTNNIGGSNSTNPIINSSSSTTTTGGGSDDTNNNTINLVTFNFNNSDNVENVIGSEDIFHKLQIYFKYVKVEEDMISTTTGNNKGKFEEILLFIYNKLFSRIKTINFESMTTNTNKLNSKPSEIDLIDTLGLLDFLNANEDYSHDLDFLQYIDPQPSLPPNYNDINVNAKGAISFPIWEIHHTSVHPPEYSPTVYDYTIVSIRTEYDSPNEKLPQFKSKVWQNFVLEINSTQINLYNIHPKLVKLIPNYNQGIIPTSILSSFQRKQAYQLDSRDNEMILDQIKINPKEYLNRKSLYDSFSLQYAKCGVPLDFLYRRFIQELNGERESEFNLQTIPDEKVIFNLIKIKDQKYLRVRLEGKQFLIKFKDVETMLLWYKQLNIGINVSLDLDLREFPDYRVVPRRRAHQYRDFHSTFSTDYIDDRTSDSENSSDLSSIEESEDESLDSILEDNTNNETEKYRSDSHNYTYEKYLSDCLRCIRPLSEMKSWLNKVIVMPTKEPKFTTKNLPKYYHPVNTTNDKFKIQNHSLGLFLLNEENDLVQLDHSVAVSWNNKYG